MNERAIDGDRRYRAESCHLSCIHAQSLMVKELPKLYVSFIQNNLRKNEHYSDNGGGG